MKLLLQKGAERELLIKEVKELFAKGDAMTDADFAGVETKNASITALNSEIERLQKLAKIEEENAAREIQLSTAKQSQRPANHSANGNAEDSAELTYTVPAVAKSRRHDVVVKAFAGQDMNYVEKQYYGFGQYYRAAFSINPATREKAAKWCKDNGLTVTLAQSENANDTGGFLVPSPLAPAIITLVEQFGVARKLFRREPMTSDTKAISRTASLINSYWLSDGQSITASTQNYDQVTLTANKLAAFILRGSEVSEDAIIDFAVELARRIAWTFAAKEDLAAFNGTGTSTYGGFNGVCNRIVTTFGGVGTTTGGAGLHVAPSGTGSAYTNYALGDFNTTQGLLPSFAWELGEPVWVMSRQFYNAVVVKLLSAAGGNTIQTIADGATGNPRFLGSPVVFSQVFPTSAVASSVMALFGNFELGCAFGDRKTITLAQSTEYAFSSDQIAIRGIERVGFNAHDVGGSNAASQAINPTYAQDGTTAVAGPIVGLYSYSS